MNKLRIKAILSSILVLVFLLVALTGVMLFFGKAGLILGFSRFFLRGAHVCLGFSMCVLIPLHLFLNIRVFKTELKSLSKNNEKKLRK